MASCSRTEQSIAHGQEDDDDSTISSLGIGGFESSIATSEAILSTSLGTGTMLDEMDSLSSLSTWEDKLDENLLDSSFQFVLFLI